MMQVRLMHNVLGGTIDPHAAFLVTRGLKTLALRVRCWCSFASKASLCISMLRSAGWIMHRCTGG